MLTPELIERICEIISHGNYISTACEACGIWEATYSNWQRRGREEIEALVDDDSSSKSKSSEVIDESGLSIYAKFYVQTKKARAEAQDKMLRVIYDTAMANKQHSWLSAAWFLERTDPARFGRRLEVPQVENKVLIYLQQTGDQLIKTHESISVDGVPLLPSPQPQ